MAAQTRFGATVAAATIVPLMLSLVNTAAADPTPSELQAARELFAHAEKDEDGGRWEPALDKLRRASSVKMTPGLRFHIALCEEKLGRLAAALNDYSASEAQARQDGNRDVLDAVAEPLAALRARIPSLTINVPANAKSTQVTLDSAPLPNGLWGTPLPVDIGPHTVQAQADGRTPFSATVSSVEHDAKVIDVKLPETASRLPSVLTAPKSSQDTGSHRLRKGALIATLGSVALVGGGVASFLVAGARQSDARAECATRTSCSNSLKLPVQALDWVALGAWVGAAAVGTVAVVLWVAPTPDGASTAEPPRASFALGPASLRLQGTF